LKDFDYCAECEETKEHKYPFLKIKTPKDAPVVMVTILPEDAP